MRLFRIPSEITQVYAELETGILLCSSIKDINNMHKVVERDFFQFMGNRQFKTLFSELLDKLGKQSNIILDRNFQTSNTI